MSESDNLSSPEKEEMDVSENGDAGKATESADSGSKTESPAKSKTESPTKRKLESPAKSKEESPTKKDRLKKDEEEDEEDDDEEEPPLGLLERPVILTSGKREKKKVERLTMAVNLPSAEKKKIEIPEGKGTKLGDCPRVEFQLQRIKAKDLKPLHRLLFNRAASDKDVKKNIRLFSGFTFAKGDKEYDKRTTSLNKMNLPVIKNFCQVLDVERKGSKTEIIERLLEFLLEPSSTGLKVPQKKKRKSKGSGDGDKKGKKRKRTTKKKEKKTANKDTVSDISDSDDDDDEEEEEEVDEEEEVKKEKKKKAKSDSEEDEDEDEAPPKKKAKVEKKEPAKKQNGKQEKAKPDKKESKKKVSDSEDSDSDDEPLKPRKEEPPSNSELKDLVKKILEGANLEEVTMKTVVKQVYDKYPSFDLTDRKDFIKTTVREIIS